MDYFEHIVCLFLLSAGPEVSIKIVNIFAPKRQFYPALVRLEQLAAKSYTIEIPNFIPYLVISHKLNDIERGQVSQFAFSTIENGARFPKPWETVLKSLDIHSLNIKVKSKLQIEEDKMNSLIDEISQHKDDRELFISNNANKFKRIKKCNSKLFFAVIDTMTNSKNDIWKTNLFSIIRHLNRISDVNELILLYKKINERHLATLESAEVFFQDFIVQRSKDLVGKKIVQH